MAYGTPLGSEEPAPVPVVEYIAPETVSDAAHALVVMRLGSPSYTVASERGKCVLSCGPPQAARTWHLYDSGGAQNAEDNLDQLFVHGALRKDIIKEIWSS